MKKAIQLIVVASCLSLVFTACKTEDKTPPAKPDTPEVKSPTKADPKAPADEGTKPSASVGVSKDTILVGQTGPQTGPAALWGAVARGTAVYFAMINEEGGIHGRKLKLLIRDDSYQPTKTKAAVMELAEKEQVFAFVGGVGTGTGMAVKGYLQDKKIPWIGPGSGSSQWASTPGRYLFSVYPTYETEARALVRYLVNDEKKKRIGFFYQNDDFGKEGLHAARDELKKLGLEMVVDVSAEMTDADLSSHVLKLKQAKPDAVIMFVLPKHAAIALGTAAKLKFKPQWASASPLSDAPLMHKITKGLWNGVVFSNFIELPDSDHPQVIKYKAAYEKFGKEANDKEQFGIFFLAGFMFAEPFVQALKNAGPDLNREKLVSELEKLNKWSGGIGHQITYGPQERQGQKAVFLAKCVDGKAKKISDWITVE